MHASELMNPYIFESNEEDQERARLLMIEAAFDTTTQAKLKKTGLGSGWHCLELGPGAGSIMKWMGEMVGPSGKVVGIDKITKHLQDLNRPPYEIVEGDILDCDFDGRFDLAHGRYVLIHNAKDADILKKIHGLLKPGRLALFEEPDFRSAQCLNAPGDLPSLRVNQAICRMFANRGLNPAYGLGLPDTLRAARFDVMEVDAALHLCPGGSAVARMMAASADALREKYMATGEAKEADLENYIANAANPDDWSVYYTTVSVIARAI